MAHYVDNATLSYRELHQSTGRDPGCYLIRCETTTILVPKLSGHAGVINRQQSKDLLSSERHHRRRDPRPPGTINPEPARVGQVLWRVISLIRIHRRID